MERIKKNFGFGFMRLPMVDGEVDKEETCKMVDAFLAAGFNYFDTAHGYLGGKSELALRDCLTSRYPREAYVLTNKLSGSFFNSREDIFKVFQEQLDACGVEYFDFYLMHAQNAENFRHYKKHQAYETALELKAAGKVRHVGISFHDTADVLDQILTEYPQIEVVQLQFNYLDYDDPRVQSFGCYEVCRKHGKPVFVMEPVKGGSLVKLPEQAQRIFDGLESGSNASLAIRFAAGFPGNRAVLSGMSTLEQLEENVAFMKDFQPLSPQEQAAVEQVRGVLRGQGLIPCTGCRYCTEVCPKEIPIPDLFACLNDKWRTGTADTSQISGGKPESCLRCGKCEEICPQQLNIRGLMLSVRGELGL